MAIVTQQQIDAKEVTKFYVVAYDKGNLLGRYLSPFYTSKEEAEDFKKDYHGPEKDYCAMYDFSYA